MENFDPEASLLLLLLCVLVVSMAASLLQSVLTSGLLELLSEQPGLVWICPTSAFPS